MGEGECFAKGLVDCWLMGVAAEPKEPVEAPVALGSID